MSLSLGLQPQLGGRTLIQRAIASLRARGSDAHLWLPGVGTINGLTTGNYLESTGNTLATVDNPTGLVLDALGSVGVELVTNGDCESATGWSIPATWAITGGKAVGAAVLSNKLSQTILAVGKTYLIAMDVDAVSGDTYTMYAGSAQCGQMSGTGRKIAILTAASNGVFAISAWDGTGLNITIDNISVREVSGIHLTQSTTANKGLLKQDAGSRYYWLFDATDLLTGTFPAGYESVTVIDAKSTGQVTTSAANIVGSYSIGPSYSSYGRIIIKGSITASELALYQGFANRLAGL